MENKQEPKGYYTRQDDNKESHPLKLINHCINFLVKKNCPKNNNCPQRHITYQQLRKELKTIQGPYKKHLCQKFEKGNQCPSSKYFCLFAHGENDVWGANAQDKPADKINSEKYDLRQFPSNNDNAKKFQKENQKTDIQQQQKQKQQLQQTKKGAKNKQIGMHGNEKYLLEIYQQQQKEFELMKKGKKARKQNKQKQETLEKQNNLVKNSKKQKGQTNFGKLYDNNLMQQQKENSAKYLKMFQQNNEITEDLTQKLNSQIQKKSKKRQQQQQFAKSPEDQSDDYDNYCNDDENSEEEDYQLEDSEEEDEIQLKQDYKEYQKELKKQKNTKNNIKKQEQKEENEDEWEDASEDEYDDDDDDDENNDSDSELSEYDIDIEDIDEKERSLMNENSEDDDDDIYYSDMENYQDDDEDNEEFQQKQQKKQKKQQKKIHKNNSEESENSEDNREFNDNQFAFLNSKNAQFKDSQTEETTSSSEEVDVNRFNSKKHQKNLGKKNKKVIQTDSDYNNNNYQTDDQKQSKRQRKIENQQFQKLNKKININNTKSLQLQQSQQKSSSKKEIIIKNNEQKQQLQQQQKQKQLQQEQKSQDQQQQKKRKQPQQIQDSQLLQIDQQQQQQQQQNQIQNAPQQQQQLIQNNFSQQKEQKELKFNKKMDIFCFFFYSQTNNNGTTQSDCYKEELQNVYKNNQKQKQKLEWSQVESISEPIPYTPKNAKKMENNNTDSETQNYNYFYVKLTTSRIQGLLLLQLNMVKNNKYTLHFKLQASPEIQIVFSNAIQVKKYVNNQSFLSTNNEICFVFGTKADKGEDSTNEYKLYDLKKTLRGTQILEHTVTAMLNNSLLNPSPQQKIAGKITIGVRDNDLSMEGIYCPRNVSETFFTLLKKRLNDSTPSANNYIQKESYKVVIPNADNTYFYPVLDCRVHVLTIQKNTSGKLIQTKSGIYLERIEEGCWPISSYSLFKYYQRGLIAENDFEQGLKKYDDRYFYVTSKKIDQKFGAAAGVTTTDVEYNSQEDDI